MTPKKASKVLEGIKQGISNAWRGSAELGEQVEALTLAIRVMERLTGSCFYMEYE